MKIVATMKVLEVTKTEIAETVKLEATYTERSNNLDNNFSAVLPQATVSLVVDNCEAFGVFVPGDRYRVEFSALKPSNQ